MTNDENVIERIGTALFPTFLTNHHPMNSAALAIALAEMVEFGEDYAKQIIKNAKALGRSMKSVGFNVLAEEFDYTDSHQIVADVHEFGGGKMVANLLKENRIVLNMNILPHEPLRSVTNPDGIRIGVQEMTRVGMKEDEMDRIAHLIKECIAKGKEVRNEVHRFRETFSNVKYSFDEVLKDLPSPNMY